MHEVQEADAFSEIKIAPPTDNFGFIREDGAAGPVDGSRGGGARVCHITRLACARAMSIEARSMSEDALSFTWWSTTRSDLPALPQRGGLEARQKAAAHQSPAYRPQGGAAGGGGAQMRVSRLWQKLRGVG